MNRLRSIESAIGLMKNIQTSVVVEENWVEAHTSKLQSLPTATSALELDVSTHFSIILYTFSAFIIFLLVLSSKFVCVLITLSLLLLNILSFYVLTSVSSFVGIKKFFRFN